MDETIWAVLATASITKLLVMAANAPHKIRWCQRMLFSSLCKCKKFAVCLAGANRCPRNALMLCEPKGREADEFPMRRR